MGASIQDADNFTASEGGNEFTGPLPLRLRHKNLIASPLLRLPTELIVRIFEHATEPADGEECGNESEESEYSDGDDSEESESDDEDDDEGTEAVLEDREAANENAREGTGEEEDGDGDPSFPEDCPTLFVLIAICHKLREIGITTPCLWGAVDLANPTIARLFLERCSYNPHTLMLSQFAHGKRLMIPEEIIERNSIWIRLLETSTFSKLRCLVFEGVPPEFEEKVIPILARAESVASVDLRNTIIPGLRFPWDHVPPIPHLRDLFVHGFSISWTSPLLRNLRRLTLDLELHDLPSAPLKTLLTTLANCPGLEVLKLIHTGFNPPRGYEGDRDLIVHLPQLQKILLDFDEPSVAGYVLSHIKYPGFTFVEVSVCVGWDRYIPEIISQALHHRTMEDVFHFQGAKSLNILLNYDKYMFSTEKSRIRCREWDGEHTSAGSKTLEVVGKEVTTLDITARDFVLEDEMWEELLHGLPLLEKISYRRYGEYSRNRDTVDSFVPAFSQPFNKGPVCPRLQDLELPVEVLTGDTSATQLKGALEKRISGGCRLKRIRPDGEVTEDELLVLESYRDLVDELG